MSARHGPNYHTSDSFYMEQFLSPREARKMKKSAKHSDIVNFPKKQLKPKTETQFYLLDALNEFDQVVTIGPAGTGKTYVTTAYAVDMLLAKEIDQIVITRPNVPAGKSIGFFPGTLEEKMGPWVAPLTEIIKDRTGNMYEYLTKPSKEIIKIIPFEVMRGRSFDNAFILLDEAQNTTVEEMKCILTRMGKNSKLIINGDIRQKDIKVDSGLQLIVDMVQNHESLENYIKVIEFDSDDIIRSDACKAWVQAFEKEGL